MWIKALGRVIYDPKRPGLKKKPDNWCILKIDDDLAGLYRWFLNKQFNPLGFDNLNLCRPSWGAHISFVRGKADLREANMKNWRRHQGEETEFEFLPIPRRTEQQRDGRGHYWVIPARCALGTQIREELGIRSDFEFHITVGRTWE